MPDEREVDAEPKLSERPEVEEGAGVPILEGEDDVPRQPVVTRDPYTPGPGVPAHERLLFRAALAALVVVAIGVAIVVVAALT